MAYIVDGFKAHSKLVDSEKRRAPNTTDLIGAFPHLFRADSKAQLLADISVHFNVDLDDIELDVEGEAGLILISVLLNGNWNYATAQERRLWASGEGYLYVTVYEGQLMIKDIVKWRND